MYRYVCLEILTNACNTLQRVIAYKPGQRLLLFDWGFHMKLSTFIIGSVVIVAALCSSFNATSVVLANDNDSDVKVMARKTYKRRCTNSKCKAITEGTQPIFKCKICGSNTVPQK